MPQIIVAADCGAAFGQGTVTLREGVTVADFQSDHFAAQLVERLGWAVEDADQLEQSPGEAEQTAEEPARLHRERRGHSDRREHTDAREHNNAREHTDAREHNTARERAEDRAPVIAP